MSPEIFCQKRQESYDVGTYVPGDTDAERMDNAVRKMFTVSKEESAETWSGWRRAHAKRQRAMKS